MPVKKVEVNRITLSTQLIHRVSKDCIIPSIPEVLRRMIHEKIHVLTKFLTHTQMFHVFTLSHPVQIRTEFCSIHMFNNVFLIKFRHNSSDAFRELRDMLSNLVSLYNLSDIICTFFSYLSVHSVLRPYKSFRLILYLFRHVFSYKSIYDKQYKADLMTLDLSYATCYLFVVSYSEEEFFKAIAVNIVREMILQRKRSKDDRKKTPGNKSAFKLQSSINKIGSSKAKPEDSVVSIIYTYCLSLVCI